ncbi:oxidoreductase [Streptomyces sp. A012304]|uniref:WD40/YVTN/BNR-like repeat-containing protein n=1 Tax=Streptomyces sp. A012304 TaxID=375446 RepID=UPI002231028C|nr:oxidoreductase [Streptomyces sp. A012304]GKQ36636.1 oxidoreductase [Streptomyces sp. A012304]
MTNPSVHASRPLPADDHAWVVTPTGVDVRLRCLAVVDHRTVWAAGANGVVLRTENGGAAWQPVGPAGADALHFRSIRAFDATHAVALTFGSGEAARIFATADGGVHWTETFRNRDPAAFYDCMTFADRRHGLALADPVEGRFRLMGTSDGGRTWSPVDPQGMPPALDGEAAFAASGTCLVSHGGQYWFATGSAARARVFRSFDLGRTWQVADTPIRTVRDAGIFALSFRSPAEGVAVGGDYTDQTRPGRLLAVTRDGGGTWRAVEDHAPPAYRSGAVWTGHAFLVVGPTGSEVSVDDGLTWTTFDTSSFDAVSRGGDGSCWASGEHGRVARLVAPTAN